MIDVADPTPGPGEVVIQVKASGICGSDLHLYRDGNSGLVSLEGAPRVVGGHEPCGVVVAVGPGVTDVAAVVGNRVMVHHYSACQHCEHCDCGWPQLCQSQVPSVFGVNAHGAHAPYMTIPAHTLVTLPESLSFTEGAAVSCGTGTAYAGICRTGLKAHQTIAIFGQGPVGLSGTQLAAAMGAKVIAIDTSADRLKLAESFGASFTINPNSDDPGERISEFTSGRGADVSLEASGNETARLAAVRCLRIWGVCCLLGARGDLTLRVGPDIIKKQLTIMGSLTFSKGMQAECARFIAEKNVDVEATISNRWTLDQIDHAYQVTEAQTNGKGMIIFP